MFNRWLHLGVENLLQNSWRCFIVRIRFVIPDKITKSAQPILGRFCEYQPQIRENPLHKQRAVIPDVNIISQKGETMQALNSIINQKTVSNINLNKYQLVTTDINKLITTDTTDVGRRKYDNDYLYEQLSDLVNQQFRAWYCKEFYRLGKDKVLQLASIARADGRQPARLFSLLIKTN
jgi:hypothetical protein